MWGFVFRVGQVMVSERLWWGRRRKIYAEIFGVSTKDICEMIQKAYFVCVKMQHIQKVRNYSCFFVIIGKNQNIFKNGIDKIRNMM